MNDHILRRAEDFKNPPTIALYMVVKNAESVIERTLKNVAPYVKDLVIVLNDTTDNTENKIFECYKKYFKGHLTIIIARWNDESGFYFNHSNFYFLDSKRSYNQGMPFGNEEYQGPFTEKPILCNWAGLRNLGWQRETDCQWKLFLDADDTIKDPESLYGVCELLDQHQADLGLSLYQYNVRDGEVFGQTYRERLIRNKPEIKWTGEVHEMITGHKKTVIISGNLVVTDNKDNKGEGTRIPDRDFKVLYRKGRLNNWNLTYREFLLLGKEIAFKMPSLAIEFLVECIKRCSNPQAHAYALRLEGIIYSERLNNPICANFCFLESLRIDPSPKVAFMTCSSLFKVKRYDDVIATYEIGCLLEGVIDSMDEGPAHKKIAQVAVEGAITERNRSLDMDIIHKAVMSFPSNPSIKTLDQEIKKY